MCFALVRLRLSLLKATQLENGCHGYHGLERILTHLRFVLFRLRRKKIRSNPWYPWHPFCHPAALAELNRV